MHLATHTNPAHLVESHRFWDVVNLWAQERVEAPEIVARALARGVIQDGLVLNSRDPRWIAGKSNSFELRGYPYVGYAGKPDGAMSILRIEALEHLLGVVREAKRPSKALLDEEFIQREHFRAWCRETGLALPAFWFPESENTVAV